MKILVKYPSRFRPEKFLNTFAMYHSMAVDKDNIHFLISLDHSDRKVREYPKTLPNATIKIGNSTNKIEACNADVSEFSWPWDIIMLASDDMIPQKIGWDVQIRNEMNEHFPDTDGVLFHNDGYLFDRLNTFCILGRKYYNRFGYLYHPAYKSFSCDAEFMHVSRLLGRCKYFPETLFKHEHPVNCNRGNDQVYNLNDAYWREDSEVYYKRKKNLFA